MKLPHGAVIANSSLLISSLFTVNVIRRMLPLFSNVDLNKLWRDVQNEETVIFWPTRYNNSFVDRFTRSSRRFVYSIRSILFYFASFLPNVYPAAFWPK